MGIMRKEKQCRVAPSEFGSQTEFGNQGVSQGDQGPIGRGAFTLVEMQVVLFIVILLAAMLVAFAPRLADRQKVAGGASQLQEWLLIAKSKARRDQIATGVRLQRVNQTDQNDPDYFRFKELQYIQQPDDFFVQPRGSDAQNQYKVRKLQIRNTAPNVNNMAVLESPVPLGAADFYGGFGGTEASLWPVQAGDYLEIKGGGLVHRILRIPNSVTLVLEGNGTPYPITIPTEDYRIIRRPRLLTGEKALTLPKDIAIDGNTRPGPWVYPPIDPRAAGEERNLCQGLAGTLDIIFSPAGGVISQGITQDRIIFWVRDVSLDNPQDGEPVLICIDVRTGFISAHPVNQDGILSNQTSLFSFTRDGKASGI